MSYTGSINQKQAGRFTFICWYWESASAWGHEARLLDRGREVAKARVRYYNRTWERYTFQTAMACAVDQYRAQIIARAEEAKRAENGGRLPRGSRLTIQKEADARDDVQGLRDYVNEHADTEAYKKLMQGAF